MLWLNQENYHNFYVQDVDIFCNQNGGKENDDDADADDDDDDVDEEVQRGGCCANPSPVVNRLFATNQPHHLIRATAVQCNVTSSLTTY